MKLPRKARAVVFDMDGLIFNTEALCRDAVMEAAAEAGHDIPLAFYLSTIGMSGETSRLAFREYCGDAFDFDLFWTAATTRFHATIKTQLRLKPGVIELLENVEALSPSVRSSGEEASDMVVPAMLVRDFHFTEVTQF